MNLEVVQISLSAVITGATIVYTIITLMMWFESRATRKQKLTPQVIPYLKTSEGGDFLCLKIKNVGEGCAMNVKVKVIADSAICGNENQLLSGLPLFNEGINVFPSGYELNFYVDTWKNLQKRNVENESLELEIIARDVKNHLYGPNRYTLKFCQIMSHYSTPPDSYIGQVAYYLKEIHKEIKNR